MKRIVWKAGKKQAVVAACVVVGAALTACGVGSTEDKVESTGNEIEETISSVVDAEESEVQQTRTESAVITESQMEAAKEELKESRKEQKKWLAGELAGTWGENRYTQTLQERVKNNGVTDYLTFAYEDKAAYDSAIVVAGEKTAEGIKGSVWYVVYPGGGELLEQNVTISGETLACIQNARECAVFLNFARNGVEEGRILGLDDTSTWELLEGVTGVKNVLEDATIEVISPVETEAGTATVRYHYALEERTLTKLETNVLEGEDYLASVDLDKLPWAQEAFHASTVSRESWDNPSIIGEQYTPDDMEAEILKGLLPDYSERWQDWSVDYWTKWDSESCYYQIFQIEETESFSVYGTYIDSRMIIETFDNSYVQINSYFTSNYGTQPQVMEMDFDQDGSLELAIITLTKHGTGVCIDDIWMVDKAGDGKWYVYELQYDWYQILDDLYDYQDTEQGLALVIKDEVVAVYSEVSSELSEKYGVGNHIYFEFADEKIILRTLFQVYTEDMMMPIYSGGYLVAELGYQGEGEWNIQDYAYESDTCDWY
ncbi:MAG: hypothetical protein IJ326_00485 [Lachnospiraceae bacterium]|nr:hypothetical protein [Lachnospiraceae bacterium]